MGILRWFREQDARFAKVIDAQDAKAIKKIADIMPSGPVVWVVMSIKGAYHGWAIGTLITASMAIPGIGWTAGGMACLYWLGKKIYYQQHGHDIETAEMRVRQVLREHVKDSRQRTINMVAFQKHIKDGLIVPAVDPYNTIHDGGIVTRRYSLRGGSIAFDILERDALEVINLKKGGALEAVPIPFPQDPTAPAQQKVPQDEMDLLRQAAKNAVPADAQVAG